ncbi:MAG: hypothetical protein LBF97_06210 [Elusimicrobiota bacterium]|jgi:hypothetical protein|nr:hypothetical protein [Elusimicrobiota bacterium]
MIAFVMWALSHWATAIVFVILFAVACNYTVDLIKAWLDFFKVLIRGQPTIKNFNYPIKDEDEDKKKEPE